MDNSWVNHDFLIETKRQQAQHTYYEPSNLELSFTKQGFYVMEEHHFSNIFAYPCYGPFEDGLYEPQTATSGRLPPYYNLSTNIPLNYSSELLTSTAELPILHHPEEHHLTGEPFEPQYFFEPHMQPRWLSNQASDVMSAPPGVYHEQSAMQMQMQMQTQTQWFYENTSMGKKGCPPVASQQQQLYDYPQHPRSFPSSDPCELSSGEPSDDSNSGEYLLFEESPIGACWQDTWTEMRPPYVPASLHFEQPDIEEWTRASRAGYGYQEQMSFYHQNSHPWIPEQLEQTRQLPNFQPRQSECERDQSSSLPLWDDHIPQLRENQPPNVGGKSNLQERNRQAASKHRIKMTRRIAREVKKEQKSRRKNMMLVAELSEIQDLVLSLRNRAADVALCGCGCYGSLKEYLDTSSDRHKEMMCKPVDVDALANARSALPAGKNMIPRVVYAVGNGDTDTDSSEDSLYDIIEEGEMM